MTSAQADCNIEKGFESPIQLCSLAATNSMSDEFLNFVQVNARTELAIRYNDISPLENHHCAVAFDIISQVKE